MKLALLLTSLLISCDGNRVGLLHAHEVLSARAEKQRQLAADLARNPREMKQLIDEAKKLAAPTEDLAAKLTRVAPAAEVSASERYFWLRGTAGVPIADAVTAVAGASPQLTAEMFYVVDGKWGLDGKLPEVAVAGAYSAEPLAEVEIPPPPFWQSAASRSIRSEIAGFQSELAVLKTKIGALDGLPALRARVLHDRQNLELASRLDRAALLITSLFGGAHPALSSGSLHFSGNVARVDGNGELAELLLAVARAEMRGGDVGWNIDELRIVEPGHVRGQVAWRPRR